MQTATHPTTLALAPPTVTVRSFSPAGPCIPLGTLVRETEKFYVYVDGRGRERKASKRTESHYSRAHVVACERCEDHPKTSFPRGYMD